MQSIKETEGNITDNKIIIQTVELPDELIRLAEDLDIDIQKIVTDRVRTLQGIFP